MKLYRYFLDGTPLYLARYYWWAYLWRPAAWFFDHQVIINAILFGQYKKLLKETLKRLEKTPNENILQLTCVYGCLTPSILKQIYPGSLCIIDAAKVQLDKACAKVSNTKRLIALRMNAEYLAFKDNSFTTIVIFFLFHEMPAEARRNTFSEIMRVTSDGGALLVTEYAPLPMDHFLYRFSLNRWVLTKLEPFLAEFWLEDVLQLLNEMGKPHGKHVEEISNKLIFSGFYRVTEYKVISDE